MVDRTEKDPIEQAAHAFLCALKLDAYDAWSAASVVWNELLDPAQRATLAFMALKALDTNDAEEVVVAALEHTGAGIPLPVLLSYMDDAAFWADLATPKEIEAYCFVTFNRMPEERQAAFLDFVLGRAAA
jgi:hypothetical protein